MRPHRRVSREANREAERARSEWAAADAEAKSAQAQIDAANKGADSVAQARAAELARAAEAHQRSATTHLDYANKLVEARQADVEVAQLHVRTVEVGGGAAVSTSASPQTDPQLVAAQDAENAARTRAADLSRAALAAQRAWGGRDRSRTRRQPYRCDDQRHGTRWHDGHRRSHSARAERASASAGALTGLPANRSSARPSGRGRPPTPDGACRTSTGGASVH